MIRIIAAGMALAAVLIAPSSHAANAKPLGQNTIKLPAMTPALNLGRMNYQAKCATCHGLKGAGTDKGPTFLHRVYHPGHHGDGSFFLASKRGTRAHHWPFGDMPPVEGITDGQVKTIVEFVRALQKANGIF